MASEPHGELHMAQLELEVPHLLRAARDQGWQTQPGRRWDDLGYLVHAQLAALFHNLSPQPFRPLEQRGRWLTVLGYTSADADQLRQAAHEFARPADREACRLDELRTKPMPASLFAAGRQLGFELRACPVARLSKAVSATWCEEPAAFKKGAELDVFLHRRYLHAGEGEREEVYLDWLRERLDGAAGVLDARLEAFRRVHLLRRGRRGEEGKRQATVSPRPDALLSGTLGVTDSDAFRALLARGVGRHRAFGFGMLLLRPPGGRA